MNESIDPKPVRATKNPEDEFQILSVASAYDGWRAVLTDPDDESKHFTFPIACWALVRRKVDDGEYKGTETEVVPMIAEVAANSPTGLEIMNSINFVGIAAPGQDPKDVVERNKKVKTIEAALESKPLGTC